jgi:hypothetical protein
MLEFWWEVSTHVGILIESYYLCWTFSQKNTNAGLLDFCFKQSKLLEFWMEAPQHAGILDPQYWT